MKTKTREVLTFTEQPKHRDENSSSRLYKGNVLRELVITSVFLSVFRMIFLLCSSGKHLLNSSEPQTLQRCVRSEVSGQWCEEQGLRREV